MKLKQAMFKKRFDAMRGQAYNRDDRGLLQVLAQSPLKLQ